MVIVGIDPGQRNLGVAVVTDGHPKCYSLVTKSGDWREAFFDVTKSLKKVKWDVLVIESVGWYGKRKGLYELNRLIGAIWAWGVGKRRGRDSVLLIMPSQKPRTPRAWHRLGHNEHQKDALALAYYGYKDWQAKNGNGHETIQTVTT